MHLLPGSMKSLFRISVLAICGFVGTAFADDFKSVVIAGDNGVSSTSLPRVHGGQFMVIRNFTQDVSASLTSGVVTVTKLPGGTPVSVLTSAILDPANSPETINSVVIAGPADVSVTCGASPGSNCFISFKKDNN
jgi:hypothetical protein